MLSNAEVIGAGIGLAAVGLCYASGALSGSRAALAATILGAAGVVSYLNRPNYSNAIGEDSVGDNSIVSQLAPAASPDEQIGKFEPTPDHMVSLRILFATTTGTARDFALQLQREAFAMHVSGFHFDISVTDLAVYDTVRMLAPCGIIISLISLLINFVFDRII